MHPVPHPDPKPEPETINNLVCHTEDSFSNKTTLKLNLQDDGTTTIAGSISSPQDLSANVFFFTIHEIGDITNKCANIGDEITTDL